MLAEKMKIAFTEKCHRRGTFCCFCLYALFRDILLGSIVCYDADEKINILDIPKEVIDQFTPESSEVTTCMSASTK